MDANIIGMNDLPGEMLMKVFRLLSPPDLKTAVLVSKAWRDLGEDPSLWSWCTIQISQGHDVNVLSFKRFQNLEKVVIGYEYEYVNEYEPWELGELQDFFEAVLKLPKVKEIQRRQCINLQLVDPELLAKSLVKLKDVGNMIEGLTDVQHEAFFKAMSLDDTPLKTLCFVDADLSKVEPGPMASVISKLEELQMFSVKVTSEQIESIFSAISQGTHLKKLTVVQINLSSVNPDVLARGVIRVEVVFLNNSELTTVQISRILTHMQENTHLKRLNLWGNYKGAYDVDSDLVRRAREKLGGLLQLDDVYD